MRLKGISLESVRLAFVLSICLPGAAHAATIPAPSISWLNTTEYVVSYSACSGCFADALQEYRDQTQRWEFVGSGSQTFSVQGPGTYRYRAVYAYALATSDVQMAYGQETSLVIDANGEPVIADSDSGLLTFDSELLALGGDLEGDGRRDLLILQSDTDGGSGAGTDGAILLRQTGQGMLEASVPDDFELAVAAGWLPEPIDVQRRDVNVDGSADLLLRGLARANGFSDVPNQIVFVPGTSGSVQSLTVRAVDEGLARFSRDVDRHLIDPEYYPDNAPYSVTVIYAYSYNCSWPYYSEYIDSYYLWYCYLQPYNYFLVYQDFSQFDPDAIAIAQYDYSMIHGYFSTEYGMDGIAATIENVLDVAIGDGQVLSGIDEDASELSEAERRGIELFAALAGISDAAAQDDVGSVDTPISERVMLKGRRVLGQGPFHTALEFRNSTVSAYDSDSRLLFDGLLVSQVNWPRDHPSLTLRLGFVDGPSEPPLYWATVREADGRYDDKLRYDLFPSIGEGGYNSNSYVAGLIRATLGVSTVDMSKFVGGEKPVPASVFN